MIIEIDGFCEKGLYREDNQDCIYAARREDGAIAVVADGMGGHAEGGKASALVCSCIQEWWEALSDNSMSKDFEELVYDLESVIKRANQDIQKLAGNAICGTTVAALLLTGKQWVLISVGDSRSYQARRGLWGINIRQLAPDDVWEQQGEIKRRLTKKERENHPDYGKLIRAVGAEKILSCHVVKGSIRSGMAFFLCSDGIYRYCAELVMKRAFAQIIGGKEIKETIEQLKKAVYEYGAPDNLSLIAVRVK